MVSAEGGVVSAEWLVRSAEGGVENDFTISCVPSVEKQSTTKICRGSSGASLSRQRLMCSFSSLVRIITAMSVILVVSG